MKKLFAILSVLLTINLNAQDINWVTFEELPILGQKEAKPIIVFIHTDWCKYCMMQEQITFSDSSIVADLNESYYCVKLNAETNETISFLNRDYRNNGNTNLLSWVLGAQNNRLSFPTTVTLSPQFQITNRWVGYLSKQDIFENSK